MLLDFVMSAGAVLLALLASAIFFPKVFICIVMFFAVSMAFVHIGEQMDKDKAKKVRKAVNKRYPEASGKHLEAIADRVMSGADIDSFAVENDVLWSVKDRKRSYWRASGNWKDESMNTDAAKLYEAERLEIQQRYPDFGFTAAEVHDLSIQLYFNWQITNVEMKEKSVVVEFRRRGDHRRVVYGR
jgi:hypothetical protein